MVRILVLLLFLACSMATTAQTDYTTYRFDKPKSMKLGEFENIGAEDFKLRIEIFYSEIENRTGEQGYIINYGPETDVAIRENQIQTALGNLNYDPNRVTFVRGCETKKTITEMWVVPQEAENPVPIYLGAEHLDSVEDQLQNDCKSFSAQLSLHLMQ